MWLPLKLFEWEIFFFHEQRCLLNFVERKQDGFFFFRLDFTRFLLLKFFFSEINIPTSSQSCLDNFSWSGAPFFLTDRFDTNCFVLHKLFKFMRNVLYAFGRSFFQKSLVYSSKTNLFKLFFAETLRNQFVIVLRRLTSYWSSFITDAPF